MLILPVIRPWTLMYQVNLARFQLVRLFSAGINSQLAEWTKNYLHLYQNVNKRRLSLEKEVGISETQKLEAIGML